MLAVHPVGMLATVWTVPMHRVMGGQTAMVHESVRNVRNAGLELGPTSWQHGSNLDGMLHHAVHRQLNLCIWLRRFLFLA